MPELPPPSHATLAFLLPTFCGPESTEDGPLAARLPQELLRSLFGLIKEDRDTLKACCSVNKSWSIASKVYLFYRIDLSAAFIRNDWLNFSLSAPTGVGAYVRHVVVKSARWNNEFTSTGARLLVHFATSITTLELSDISIDNFASLASTISKFKQLRSLYLTRVTTNTNTIDYSHQGLTPHQTLAQSVTDIRMLQVNTGPFLGWLLAHPEGPFVPASFHLGPVNHGWRSLFFDYLEKGLHAMSELGLLFPEATGLDPYSTTCYVIDSGRAFDGSIRPVSPPPVDAELDEISNRFQSRHGFSMHPVDLILSIPFPGKNLRTIYIYKFISNNTSGSHNIRTVWLARVLVTLRCFRGTILLEVDATNVGIIDALAVDWDLVDDIVSVYREFEAVVFLATTDISLSGLENLLSLRMPKAYGKGLLRVERRESVTQ